MRIERTEVPPSGFNSYDCWGIDINEERAFKLIDAFVQKLKHRKKKILMNSAAGSRLIQNFHMASNLFLTDVTKMG